MIINPFIFLNQAFKYIPKKQEKQFYSNFDFSKFIQNEDHKVSLLEQKKKKKKEFIETLYGLSIIYIDKNYDDIKVFNTEYIILIHNYKFIYYLNNNFRNNNINNKKLICSLPFSFNDENDPTIRHNLWYSILKNNEQNDRRINIQTEV